MINLHWNLINKTQKIKEQKWVLRWDLIKKIAQNEDHVNWVLEWTLITWELKNRVDVNLKKILELKPIADLYGWYKKLLWWDSELSIKNWYHLNLNVGRLYKKAKVPINFWFWSYIDNWVNYQELWEKYPHKRCKIYLSLLLNTNEKEEKAKEFYSEIIKLCNDKKLSIWLKGEDHNYDSLNLYTWHLKEVLLIIQKLYPKYCSFWIFQNVPHFFQSSIDWIAPDHIWYVNEPLLWYSWWSHSVRMSKLWELIDSWVSFEDACKKLSLNPENPSEIIFTNEKLSKYLDGLKN